MVATLREIINVSLVIVNLELLATDDAVQRFQTAADVDVRYGGGVNIDVISGQSNQSRVLHLDRDRINLNLAAARSAITKEFPAINNLEGETSRFAEVVNHALSAGQHINNARYDFGYNAEMVFDQDISPTAFEFLGDRLIKHENIAQPGCQFLGGACRMVIRDEHSRQWTYNLEPRFNDVQTSRVFININLHNQQRRLPEGMQTASAINQIVSNATSLMNRLSE